MNKLLFKPAEYNKKVILFIPYLFTGEKIQTPVDKGEYRRYTLFNSYVCVYDKHGPLYTSTISWEDKHYPNMPMNDVYDYMLKSAGALLDTYHFIYIPRSAEISISIE